MKPKIPRSYENELHSFEHVLQEGDEIYDDESPGRLKKTFSKLAERLKELEVSYALVGGYALILHGVRRFTEDIDLLVTNKGLENTRTKLLEMV